MTEPPGGPWAMLMVGHQWPGSTTLAAVSAAAAARHALGAEFHSYADVLRSVNETMLAEQEGDAADGVRASFRDGESHARGVAERNAAKNAALTRAHRQASELRSALTEIADRGGRQISAIMNDTRAAGDKIAGIVEVVRGARADADVRSALSMQEVYGSIQHVLDSCGQQTSARQFAHAHGVDLRSLHSAPAAETLQRQVRSIFERYSGAIAFTGTTGTGAEAVEAGARVLPATPAAQAARMSGAGSSSARAVAAPAARPLIPYGADVRAAPTPAAPASAPLSTPQVSGPAAAATAVLTGTGGASSPVRERPPKADSPLAILLHAVARQQPGLRWAVAADGGTTVLATDVASGWIPPGIEIPAGVTLLEPAARTGRLEDWLTGHDMVMHHPGDPVPPGGDPLRVVGRPYTPVEDLGSRLIQATRRRDGVPWLRHTRATLQGPEIPESEKVLLRDRMEATAARALASYPDPVSTGDWQLLAALVAVIDGECGLAHYHFGWFEALSR